MKKELCNKVSFKIDQRPLLPGLWQNSILSKEKSPLSSSSPSQISDFCELNQFRTKIQENGRCPAQTPYHQSKQPASLYRMIFFGISAVFVFLSFLVASKTTSFFCNILFSNCGFAKACITGFCMICSAAAFGFGLSIRAEKEAATEVTLRAVKRLAQIYKHKRLEMQKNLVSLSHKEFSAFKEIRHAYHETKDRLHESKQIAMQLLKAIKRSREISFAEKENLFNQALLELHDNLNGVIKDFVYNT